ncbi:MAG: class I SAM-dependent methyltransferase [Magnetococcales bacterium]|nr:class I SAM-dependent methyltransferase [Magnetococcales bacterium]
MAQVKRGHEGALDSILLVGAMPFEIKIVLEFPFQRVIVSNIEDFIDPTTFREIMVLVDGDERLDYCESSLESLSFPGRSFDLVVCKETLHHLSRPVLGLYEMLRVCRHGLFFIEGNLTLLTKLLRKTKIGSSYEENWSISKGRVRDNFVFKWDPDFVVEILRSYYLESGFSATFYDMWYSSRFHQTYFLRVVLLLLNRFSQLIPLFPRGNYLICLILPGHDIPHKIGWELEKTVEPDTICTG